MSIDRDVFFEVLGGESAVATMSDEALTLAMSSSTMPIAMMR